MLIGRSKTQSQILYLKSFLEVLNCSNKIMKPGLNLGGGRRLLQSSDYITRATGPERQEGKKSPVWLKKRRKQVKVRGKATKHLKKKGKKRRKVRSPNIGGRSLLKRRRKKQKREKGNKAKEIMWKPTMMINSAKKSISGERNKVDVIFPILGACTCVNQIFPSFN